jgi:hypothetical protein
MEQELDPANKIEASWAIHINKLTGEFSAIRRDDEFFESDFEGVLICSASSDSTSGKEVVEQEGKQDLPPSGIILNPA